MNLLYRMICLNEGAKSVMDKRKKTLSLSLMKEILFLALPIIVQGLVFGLQSLTDKAFLGQLKTEYVSAIGAAQLPLGATMDSVGALAIGVTIIVAHLVGAGKMKETARHVKSAVLYSWVIGAVFGIIWEVFTGPILLFFKVDPLIISHSIRYVRICGVAFFAMGIDSTLNGMLQGMGKTKIIMYSGMIKVAFNIVLSWILIFGKCGFRAYHVDGAALGTLLSNVIAFAYILVYCFVIKRKEFGFDTFEKEDVQFSNYKKVLALGAPACLEVLLWQLSNLVLVRFINEFSYVSTSIYTVTFGIMCIICSIYMNSSRAGLTLIGQSLGAKDYQKANAILYNCMLMNTVLIVGINVIFQIWSGEILGIFLREQYIVELAEKYLKFLGLVMFPQSLNIICGNAIKGNGNTRWMLFSQMLGSTVVVSLSYFLVRIMKMDMMAIYIVFFVDESVRGLINYIYYKKKYLNGMENRFFDRNGVSGLVKE